MTAPAKQQLYADDLPVGLAFEGAPRIVTDESFRSFANITGDDHPIHYDAEYARQTRFKKPLAHGLLLMGMTAFGATEMSDSFHESMVALVGQECRFLHPVFVGDTVSSRFQVASVERRSSGDVALVTYAVKLIKEIDVTVLEGYHAYHVRYRPT